MTYSQNVTVYIGTYTSNDGSKGIYRSILDLQTGKLSSPVLAVPTPNPSFLVISDDLKYLYAVAELSPGMVRSFSIDSDTKNLRFINEVSSGGAHPCHLAIQKRLLLAANYSSGSVIAVPLNSDGSLSAQSHVVTHKGNSVNPSRQKSPHAHSVDFRGSDMITVADLGLDKIMIYRWNPTAALLESAGSVAVHPGAGPRHLAFFSNRFAYVINELDNTMEVFVDDGGKLNMVQTISTLPHDYKGNSACAEVQFHPNGKFLYASNRGHDSLAVFRVDSTTGKLSDPVWQTDGIKWPRHFILTSDGRWCLVANEKGDSVVVFKINSDNGRLEPTGNKIAVSKPVCVQLMP